MREALLTRFFKNQQEEIAEQESADNETIGMKRALCSGSHYDLLRLELTQLRDQYAPQPGENANYAIGVDHGIRYVEKLLDSWEMEIRSHRE